jgi:hypothetical protein
MDGRVKEIYPYFFPQLASASHIAILAAYWEDRKRWLNIQGLVGAQQMTFVDFSLVLAVVYLSRKVVVWITRVGKLPNA